LKDDDDDDNDDEFRIFKIKVVCFWR